MRSRLFGVAIGLSCAAFAPLRSQTPTATPRWEVVSIRPCEPTPEVQGKRGGGIGVSTGRLHVTCVSAKFLTEAAYVMSQGHLLGSVPVSGGPAWFGTAQFDIEAKAEGTPAGQMMQGAMLQALLEDRFKLKLHHETRQIPVYELTVAKTGFKLQPLAEGACTPLDLTKPIDFSKAQPLKDLFGGACGVKGYGKGAAAGTWKIDLKGMTLDEIAENLRNVLDRPVINKTGIAGRFNFHLEFAPDEVSGAGLRGDGTIGPILPIPDEPLGGPSIFTAIQEQVGLKLDGTKGPGDSIVVDSAQRPEAN